MFRSTTEAKTKRGRLRALPWAALARGGVVVLRRVRAMSQKDRARLARLLRESGGRPGNLGPKQRAELRVLVGKLDLKNMIRDLISLARPRRGAGRSRRRGR